MIDTRASGTCCRGAPAGGTRPGLRDDAVTALEAGALDGASPLLGLRRLPVQVREFPLFSVRVWLPPGRPLLGRVGAAKAAKDVIVAKIQADAQVKIAKIQANAPNGGGQSQGTAD
jgi:hypothetical protein